MTHNILRVRKNIKSPKDGEHLRILGKFREWPSIDIFIQWRKRHLKLRQDHLKDKLTPLQFYVTQGIGHERPFSGDHWWTKDVGMYDCVCCK